MRVTVFGGAQPQTGDPLYEDAYQLGFRLGQLGYTLLTGGYIGTMQAVSQGAVEAGSHVIGVTCREIEAWRSTKANPWVREEWFCETLFDRLQRLIDACDVAVALPGGVGTLAEILLMWNRLAIRATKEKPLILIGEGWQHTLSQFILTQRQYIPGDVDQYLTFVPTAIDAVEVIQKFKTRTLQEM